VSAPDSRPAGADTQVSPYADLQTDLGFRTSVKVTLAFAEPWE